MGNDFNMAVWTCGMWTIKWTSQCGLGGSCLTAIVLPAGLSTSSSCRQAPVGGSLIVNFALCTELSGSEADILHILAPHPCPSCSIILLRNYQNKESDIP